MISTPTNISQTQTQFAMVLDELKIHSPNSETSPGRAVIQSIQAARNDATEVHGTRPRTIEDNGGFKSRGIDPPNAISGPVNDCAKKLTQVMEGVTLSDRISGSPPPSSTKLNDKRCVTPPLSSSQNTKIISSPGSAFMSPSRSAELTGSSIREDNFTRRQQLNSNNPTPPPIKWDEQPSSRSSSSLLRKPLSISSSRESPHVLPSLKSTHSLDDLPETLNYRTTPSFRPSSRGSASLGYPSKYSPQFSPVMYSSPIKACTDIPLTTITENSEEMLDLRDLKICRGNLKLIGRILNEGDQQSDDEEDADFSMEKLISSYSQNLLIDTTNLFEKILKRCTPEDRFTKYKNGEISLEALPFPASVDREELQKTHRKLVAREEELLAVRAARSSTIHNRVRTIQGKMQQLLTILFREDFTNGPEEIVNILKELRRMSELYPEIKEQILSYTREFHGLWESTQGKTRDKRGSYITISKKRAALANKIANDNPLEKRIKAKKLTIKDVDQGEDFSP